MRRKIALLGGTFNPIHHGHLRLALDLVESVGFEQLRLVPCHLPQHRQQPTVSSDRRAQMVAQAIAGCDVLQLDRCELERGSATYSIDTLTQLRRELGDDASLTMVMGIDAYLGLPRWHRWRELLTQAHLLVVARPGYSFKPDAELAEYDRVHRAEVGVLAEKPAGSVVHLSARLLDISATEVRELTAQGRSTQYLIPDAVRHYISEHGLYSADAHSS
ncbi:nicotinate-nucleotide adenylyltransferase [Gilvimarinus agarilyticus]|uniref:nicotinate-nucleotide adenylyltransferase n=1 Tax=unclassified Gilvimarinus TaxID=2642066 RepID=UPI001C0A3A63|nr:MULTISPECIES: nicotinate-nucleotide adenylyltransferase [unclassified Gilvimarinus]MBU2887619.1 nicotinate-nucleotide adenylyltransferase [Gilvimarinus agarilyticus]MDO6572270.1 nicotinate-nucleotide adenylyltransferase [Gilvimarinus sp. 2_MG-2023]MDO6746837.1 nicotinate-nucleotide adenylyltransferase [Gilvimarinus sp. 1_MG-2023]